MKPRFRKFMLCAAIAMTLNTTTLVIAQTQTVPDVPCGPNSNGAIIQASATAASERAVTTIKETHSIQSLMLQNAMNCLQRIKDLLSKMAVPTFPDLLGGSLEAILAYLANQACRVVEGKVVKVIPQIPQIPTIKTIPGGPEIKPVTTPWGDALKKTDSQIDKAIDSVTNAADGYASTASASTSGTTSGSGSGSTSMPGTSPPPSSSVWDRVSCAFSSNGTNCK
jgi:hypothetical protein